MVYRLFFPFPVKHSGLFKHRFELINELKEKYQNDSNFVFRKSLPNASKIANLSSYIAKNTFSNEYLGKVLTDNDSWKFIAAFTDLDNLYQGIIEAVEQNYSRIYFFTNSGGHHADNLHYELFCPLNQLFFIAEVLNVYCNFPDIVWVDIDAHFGNGDKKIFDSYKQKMKTETNNLSGICFHNDSGNVNEDSYIGVSYEPEISSQAFMALLEKKVSIRQGTKFILLFFGTDIFKNDYGGNKNLEVQLTQPILEIFDKKATNAGATLMIIQTGGSNPENIKDLLNALIRVNY